MAHVINLTVIGDRTCSTTRTYLHYLQQAGLRPKNLWLVDFKYIPRRQKIARKILGGNFADRLFSTAKAPSISDAGFNDFCLALQKDAGLPPIDYQASWKPAEYAEDVNEFAAQDFHDQVLQGRMLKAAAESAFLYTNGGIVPASILDRPSIRVLHIHPGMVPEVRGSDRLLWSALVRRRIGVSCFYMSPGIDEGAIIGQQEFDLPKLPSLAPYLTAALEEMAYRALLFAVDPHFRAKLLINLISPKPGRDLRDLATSQQSAPGRTAYLWMHPRLRLASMRKAFL